MTTGKYDTFHLNVEIEGKQTEIYVDENNIDGEVVYTVSIPGMGSNELSMDMETGNLVFRQQYPYWQQFETLIGRMIEARNR